MKMTVREVIERLEAAAQDMELGLDSPMIVMLCDGTDVEGSQELEIDTLTFVSKSDGSSRDFAVMIKGHPHIDKDEGQPSHFRGLASDADTALREWTGEDGGEPGSPS